MPSLHDEMAGFGIAVGKSYKTFAGFTGKDAIVFKEKQESAGD